MTDLRKAAETALEALENTTDFVPVKSGLEREVNNSIQTLRQALAREKEIDVWGKPLVELREAFKEAEAKALAQPEQEPVAWIYEWLDEYNCWNKAVHLFKPEGVVCDVKNVQPLYTAPPKQPQQESVKCMYPYCETAGGCDGPCSKPLTTPVDAVNMTQKRVDETAKREHGPVAWRKVYSDGTVLLYKYKSPIFGDHELEPLYTAPPKSEWVGLEDEKLDDVTDEFYKGAVWAEAKLKEKNT